MASIDQPQIYPASLTRGIPASTPSAPVPLITPAMASMHYPQLLSTTAVSAGMIAMDAVVSDWPGGSAPRQPCQHVLNRLPYAPIMCVAQGVECGSHAATPATLTIRRGAYRSPSWSREC